MTAKEFVFNKYPHLKHPLEGENPVVDFELNTLCNWLEEYASHVTKSPTWIPVTERKPNESKGSPGFSDDILLLFPNNLCAIGYYNFPKKIWVYDSDTYSDEEIKGWMPLPLPPDSNSQE